jgi:hypothetical protein
MIVLLHRHTKQLLLRFPFLSAKWRLRPPSRRVHCINLLYFIDYLFAINSVFAVETVPASYSAREEKQETNGLIFRFGYIVGRRLFRRDVPQKVFAKYRCLLSRIQDDNFIERVFKLDSINIFLSGYFCFQQSQYLIQQTISKWNPTSCCCTAYLGGEVEAHPRVPYASSDRRKVECVELTDFRDKTFFVAKSNINPWYSS